MTARVHLLCKFYKHYKQSSGETLRSRQVVLYHAFAHEARTANQRMWKFLPKLHLILQLCEWEAPDLGNPAYYWTYADDDLVGLMVELAEACQKISLPVLRW